MDNVPSDLILTIALHLDSSRLKSFAQINKRTHQICQTRYFKNTWAIQHNELTLDQREAIDSVLNTTIDTLIKLSNRNLLDQDIIEIKNKIMFQIKIFFGRDLRYFLLKKISTYLKCQYHACELGLPLRCFSDYIIEYFDKKHIFYKFFNVIIPKEMDPDEPNEINKTIDHFIYEFFQINGLTFNDLSYLNHLNKLIEILPQFKNFQ